eukprot:1012552-Rhodomonas_salina.1
MNWDKEDSSDLMRAVYGATCSEKRVRSSRNRVSIWLAHCEKRRCTSAQILIACSSSSNAESPEITVCWAAPKTNRPSPAPVNARPPLILAPQLEYSRLPCPPSSNRCLEGALDKVVKGFVDLRSARFHARLAVHTCEILGRSAMREVQSARIEEARTSRRAIFRGKSHGACVFTSKKSG